MRSEAGYDYGSATRRQRGPSYTRRRLGSVSLERRRLTEAVDQPPAASSQIEYVEELGGDLGDCTGLC